MHNKGGMNNGNFRNPGLMEGSGGNMNNNKFNGPNRKMDFNDSNNKPIKSEIGTYGNNNNNIINNNNINNNNKFMSNQGNNSFQGGNRPHTQAKPNKFEDRFAEDAPRKFVNSKKNDSNPNGLLQTIDNGGNQLAGNLSQSQQGFTANPGLMRE